ncbi:MAG: imidazole glycerol phosphate synthase subunit HisH [Candidatus Nanopelagicales bacterium]|nr:imidazole glycerol phosphate synthase subunit HisH [Candidatus Nanopelagicales bacterium]MDZ4248946.1 imidazole glycerol phosphate synthase subunit HisH [Candidatus Nanopelagicales bacterium]
MRKAAVLVDFGLGNLDGLARALERAGVSVMAAASPERIETADWLILPGVGAFPPAMQVLRSRGLDEAITRFSATGKPLLGVCLGLQLMFDESSEHESTRGLGLIRGSVQPLESRTPRIGWQTVDVPVRVRHARVQRATELAGSCVFFNHNFQVVPDDAEVIELETVDEQRTPALVRSQNLIGVQFHPEKSQIAGARFLQRLFSGQSGLDE